MTTSNSLEPVGTTGTDAASAAQSVETTPQSTTTQAAATTPATSSPGMSATGEVIPPAYQPNHKFKAFGKEHELEEFWRPLVKDPESEKKVKDVFTKAYAFEDLKSRFDGTQSEFQQVSQEYEALDRDVRKVTSFLNRGDLDNFFNSIGLSEQKIFDWAEQKINQENLPPEQKNALRSQAVERQRSYDLEQEKAELENRFQSQAVQTRTMQLEMTLLRPEIAQAANSWDSQTGQQGSFRDLIIEEAQLAWHRGKTDITAEQAANLVLAKYGKLISSGTVSQMQNSPGISPTPQATGKPVIPAVQGRGTSPIKKSPKSIDDLRDLAKEYAAQGS